MALADGPTDPLTAPPPAPPAGTDELPFAVSAHAGRFVDDGVGARALIADLVPADGEALKLTASLCPDCLAAGRHDRLLAPAATYAADGAVRLRTRCPDHGTTTALSWRDADLYRRAAEWGAVGRGLGAAVTDADADAGPGIGNVTVTNRCDRSCHYCFFYAEGGEPLHEPTRDEIESMAASLSAAGASAIQLTGGEPTVREDLPRVVERVAPYAEQVLVNTHGARFAHDPDLAAELSAAGARGIYTSLDGVTPETNPKSYPEFPDTLAACREAGLCAMLVPTVVGGWNDDGLGDLVRFGAANADVVCGINLQPVSFVGRMGDADRRARRVTVSDVVDRIAAGTDGAVPREAWFPLPALRALTDVVSAWTGGGLYGVDGAFSAWLVTVVLVEDDEIVPITEVREAVASVDGDLAEAGRLDRLRVARRLSGGVADLLSGCCGADGVADALAGAFTGGFDGLADRFDRVLPVGIKQFQDPYNYDLDRVADADVAYAMPDGEVVPFSVYNVAPERYRDRAKREHAVSVEEWLERDYARLEEPDAPNRRPRGDEVIDAAGGDGDGDGAGVFGADLTYSRDLSAPERERVHERYAASIERLDPVWTV
jgi:uncharacterized radical SAM superfamily Fe-S cluster-containing enzyme